MKKNRDYDVGRQSCLRKILIVCCFFMGMLLVPRLVFAQKEVRVSLQMKNVTLVQVFDEIKKQCGYEFVYSSNQLTGVKNVSIDVKNELLDKVLELCLKETNLGFKVEENHVIISPKLKKNQSGGVVIYSGKVVDRDGIPLPGVTIVLKGTSTGISTDVNGRFELAVPAGTGNVLEFSFVGMKKQEVFLLKNKKEIEVTMEEEINAVDEVVVNGLYTQNKNSYTGSVSTLKGEDLLQVSQTNIFQALSVLTPGLRIVEDNAQGSNPNHIPEIIIRGTTSLAAEGQVGLNRPLIILDGVEITLEQLYDIDMFEIDRVDVLKDASATVMYGDRAANGVIVVQRKRVTDSKVKVRYNFVPDVQFPDVSSFKLCNPRQKLELERLYGEYDDPYYGKAEVEYNEKLKRINAGVNTDWKSKPLRNTWSFNHSLNMSGRGGGIDYSVSLRYGDTRGIMKGDFRQNYGVRFYFSYQLANKLTISYTSDWTRTDAKDSPYGNFSDFVRLNPYDAPKNEYGEWNKRLSFNKRNPLYDATTNSFNKNFSTDFRNSLSMRWDILKGIYASGMFSYSVTDSQSEVFDSPESSTWLDETEPGKRGSYAISNSRGNGWSLSYGLSYSKAMGTDETTYLSLNAGGTATRNKSSNFSFAGLGFLKPEFNDLSYASSFQQERPNGSEALSTSLGWYGNINFIYDNRYFIDGSFRVSGASNYGVDDLYAPYWSLGAGWNAHNESFLKNTFVNSMRFRFSLGYVGSGNFGDLKPETIYKYKADDRYDTGLGTVPSSMGNKNLKSQRTLSLNGGVTMEMLENRLQMDFNYYRTSTKDMLLPIELPPSTGNEKVYANFGESENLGYEFSISVVLIKRKDLYWRVSANTHHTVNKIKKLNNTLKQMNELNRDSTNLSSPKIQFEEGESQDAIYAVHSKGIDPANGMEIFVKKDGSWTYEYDVKDKVAMGTTVPKLEGSISTFLTWKRISVSAAFSYTYGSYMYNDTRAAQVENINYQENVDRRAMTERWHQPGDIVKYVKVDGKRSTGFVHSERFVEKRNELNLTSLGFNYDFNPEWVRHIGLKRLAVGVTFSDVFRLSTMRFERGTSYPYMRSFNFSISPTF